MPRRFFVTGPIAPGPRRLDGAEAHHLIHVLRIGVGERISLFDGSGFEGLAELTGIANGTVNMTIREVLAADTEPPVALVLAAAVPKGDRFGWLIEKATELGVQRFVPLIAERSVVVPGAGKLEKMRRTIVEASKQCGRSRLMELDAPVRWAEFVACDLASSGGWVAHPTGAPVDASRLPTTGPILAAVGPEGGFTAGELELAVGAGATLVSLGPRVLRIETAALARSAAFLLLRSAKASRNGEHHWTILSA
jgi:16S rRNA (uracil1498-N3)-methyltransferase